MANPKTKEDFINAILDLSMDNEVNFRLESQELLVKLLREGDGEEPTPDEVTETNNNVMLLDHMRTDDFKQELRDIYSQSYMGMDRDVLNYLYINTKTNKQLGAASLATKDMLENLFNSYDFLEEVSGFEEETETPAKVLH